MIYAVLLVIGSVLAASAQDAQMFIVAASIQGLCASPALIAAVPPGNRVVPRTACRDCGRDRRACASWPAVAFGTLHRRTPAQSKYAGALFWIIAGISVVALLLTLLTFDETRHPPTLMRLATRWRSRWQPSAARLPSSALHGELHEPRFLRSIVIVPLLGGLATLVVLVIYEYRSRRPSLTVRPLLTSSIPVAGIVVALFAAAASVSATALTYGVLVGLYSPLHIGLLFPEVGGAVVSTVVLGQVVQRRAPCTPPVRRHDPARGPDTVFRIEVPSTSQVLTLRRIGTDGARTRRHGRTRTVRRRVFATRVTSSAYSQF